MKIISPLRRQIHIAFGIDKLKVSLLHKTATDTAPMKVVSAKIVNLKGDLDKQTSKVP